MPDEKKERSAGFVEAEKIAQAAGHDPKKIEEARTQIADRHAATSITDEEFRELNDKLRDANKDDEFTLPKPEKAEKAEKEDEKPKAAAATGTSAGTSTSHTSTSGGAAHR